MDLRIAVVEADALRITSATAAQRAETRAILDRVQQHGAAGGEPRREAVRKLLRFGGFKPSGRSKPAQEYLMRVVAEQQALPEINNAVDLINCASVSSGLPISLLARDRLPHGAILRYGRSGESFVFNRAGQQLQLAGLLCICAMDEMGEAGHDVPLGSPVKDSLAGKITDENQDVAAVIYAPLSAVEPAELHSYAQELAAGFQRHCGASAIKVQLLASERRAPV